MGLFAFKLRSTFIDAVFEAVSVFVLFEKMGVGRFLFIGSRKKSSDKHLPH